MTSNMETEARKGFLTTFRSLARHKHRYDVFKDFVTMAALFVVLAGVYEMLGRWFRSGL